MILSFARSGLAVVSFPFRDSKGCASNIPGVGIWLCPPEGTVLVRRARKGLKGHQGLQGQISVEVSLPVPGILAIL
jgi:hypothetical protein